MFLHQGKERIYFSAPDAITRNSFVSSSSPPTIWSTGTTPLTGMLFSLLSIQNPRAHPNLTSALLRMSLVTHGFVVVPRHPLRGLRLHFLSMAPQLDQVVEEVGVAQLTGVNQAHEQITHLRPIQRPIKQAFFR